MRSVFSLPDLRQELETVESLAVRGRITALSGPTLKAALSGVSRGDLVKIRTRRRRSGNPDMVVAQVVGFDLQGATLSPFSPPTDVICGSEIEVVGKPMTPVTSQLLGAVLSSNGAMIRRIRDSGKSTRMSQSTAVTYRGGALEALAKKPIDAQFVTGIPSIDFFAPIGRGQRLAIIAEPGVGKTSLLARMARASAPTDVVVIALIGERGREVNDFINRELDANTRNRCVIVVSTSDEAPAARLHAAELAMSTAESFRDQGRSVILLMDSLTRYARAMRELGLGAGEPPIRQGYPPSLFSELPRLFERAGNWERGSITALFTLLATDDILGDPLIEEVQSLLDGQIRLSSDYAEKGIFPAVSIVESMSRLQNQLLTPDLQTAVRYLRKAYADFRNDRELHIIAGKPDIRSQILEQVVAELRSFLYPLDADAPIPSALVARKLISLTQRAKQAFANQAKA